MPIATRRHSTLSIPRPARKTARAVITECAPAPDREVYELLSEAAHLLSRAGRELRKEHLRDGLAVQGLADEVHTHIRQLPSSARRGSDS